MQPAWRKDAASNSPRLDVTVLRTYNCGMDGYDLIGDIHGYAEPLLSLLKKLGYQQRFGCFRHPDRQAIFVGDFIDRGPGQREVVETVRRMVEDGAALAVMGNHELNALAYHTPDPDAPGAYLRPRTDKNFAQHRAFLDAHTEQTRLQDTLEWFRQLPLWLDLGELRVIHAAWVEEQVQWLRARLPAARVTDDLLVQCTREGTSANLAMEAVLKGPETRLPPGVRYVDKGGHVRTTARLRWWLDPQGQTWRSMTLVPPETAAQLPEQAYPDTGGGYPTAAPPVFFGHYWLSGSPAPLADNVACLDYSVAAPGGRLVAYRWDNESRLSAAGFQWVSR